MRCCLMLLFMTVFCISITTGCTSVNVKPIDSSYTDINTICIEHNSKSLASEVVSVVEDGFKRNGINTELYTKNMPEYCHYILKYEVDYSWDMVRYLKHVDLTIYKADKLIASATYHTGGGFDMSKYHSVDTKLNPVIDELLINFRNRKSK